MLSKELAQAKYLMGVHLSNNSMDDYVRSEIFDIFGISMQTAGLVPAEIKKNPKIKEHKYLARKVEKALDLTEEL